MPQTTQPIKTAAGRANAGWLAVVWLSAVLLSGFPRLVHGQSPGTDVQRSVKAVCLLNFAQFVTWPSQCFASNTTPITIGILGSDPFGKVLDDAVLGEKVGHRQIAVKRFTSLVEAKTCQILFISRSERERMETIRAGLHRLPVLTVSETESFCQQGGMINFIVLDDRVKFEMNPQVAEAAGLKVSSKLLNLAKLVTCDESKTKP